MEYRKALLKELSDLWAIGDSALANGDHLRAEYYYKLALHRAGGLGPPHYAPLALHFMCLQKLAFLYRGLDADPEAVPYLERAYAAAKDASRKDPSWEVIAFDTAMDLARAYQGASGYIVPAGNDVKDGVRLHTDQEQMRAVRRAYTELDMWPTKWLRAPAWHAHGAGPLREAIRLAEGRGYEHPRRWNPRLAEALVLLTEVLLNAQCPDEVEGVVGDFEFYFANTAKRSAKYSELLARARDARQRAKHTPYAATVLASDMRLRPGENAHVVAPVNRRSKVGKELLPRRFSRRDLWEEKAERRARS
jgi:hypothetical protein